MVTELIGPVNYNPGSSQKLIKLEISSCRCSQLKCNRENDETGSTPPLPLSPTVIILLIVQRRCLLWIFYLLFVFRVCVCHTVLSVPYSLVIPCWERADLLLLLCYGEKATKTLPHMGTISNTVTNMTSHITCVPTL